MGRATTTILDASPDIPQRKIFIDRPGCIKSLYRLDVSRESFTPMAPNDAVPGNYEYIVPVRRPRPSPSKINMR
jgi:hypothetical protein